MKSLDLRGAAPHTGNARFPNVTPWRATAQKGVGQRSPTRHYLAGSCPQVQDSAPRSGVFGFRVAASDFAGRQWRHARSEAGDRLRRHFSTAEVSVECAVRGETYV